MTVTTMTRITIMIGNIDFHDALDSVLLVVNTKNTQSSQSQ